jgi:F420H(2)-dependent quinone reductase
MSELSDFNERVINEFRANNGKVSGQMANMPLLLLTTTGAKTGRSLMRPLAYTKDGDRIVVIASYAGSPQESAVVSQFGRQPRRHRRSR